MRETSLPPSAGLSLKPEFFREILDSPATLPEIGFWEIHAENYLDVDDAPAGGPWHRALRRIRERYPLSIHGVGLSIGSEARPDSVHLGRLKRLNARYEPASFSEHLAWSRHNGVFFADLLPLPYDEATLARVCSHIAEVQDRLGRRVLIENPATYLGYAWSSMAEPQFVTEVVKRSGCGLLLDVNNVFVSARNQGLDAQTYLAALPLHAVSEIHLAGFAVDHDSAGIAVLIDSHDAPVHAAVWTLYEAAIARTGPVASLIERDANLPPLAELRAEAAIAAQHLAHAANAHVRQPA